MAASTTPLILVMGPTAAGKSALALALAERFPVEIVSVDSAQIYRGMDIGTAKPDARTQARVPHHLLDQLDPTESYSAARFVVDALRAIAAVRSRGRIPLLVGGTMLYFKALTEGLSELPSADPYVRAQIDEEARARGWAALHRELAQVDPATAARLEPADAQRIQRALEVYRLSGVPLSTLQLRRVQPTLGTHASFALLPAARDVLHEAIARRFDAMLAAGLVEEVVRLRATYALTAEMPSMRSVGYRQVWRYLEGDGDLALLRSRAIAATRQLAKRQLTWLRAIPARPLDAESADATDEVARVVEALRDGQPEGVGGPGLAEQVDPR